MPGENSALDEAAAASLSVRRAGECLARGDIDAAERFCRDAIQRIPRHAEAQLALGMVMLRRHRPREAVLLIEESLAGNVNNPTAHANLGLALRALGRLDEALDCFARALGRAPDFVGALIEHGNTLLDLGRSEQALASFKRAVQFQPTNAHALNGCGNAQLDLGDARQALAHFDSAFAGLPQAAWLHANRGVALANLGLAAEALAACDAAIALEAADAAAHHTRGDALQDLHRYSEAVAAYDQALALEPVRPRTWSNRARCLMCLDRWTEAEASYDQALQLAETRAVSGGQISRTNAWVNRGSALHFLCRLDEARDSFQSALRLEPEQPAAHSNLSHSLLLGGDFTPGWQEFEWRWRLEQAEHRRHTSRPLWLGDRPLAGATILLYEEQGLGDTLQFCRYAPILAARGARVILEVSEPLRELMTSLAGVTKVVGRGAALPPFDYQCPMMSLPLACATTLASIPGDAPYLHADPRKVRHWHGLLGSPDTLRVGLVWSGGTGAGWPDVWGRNTRRNVPLRSLQSLEHPRIQFYSLQKGQPAESEWAQLRSEGWDGPELIDWTSELHDFSDTAALVENLDLIISVDTSTAHLAGALGKPVWILNRFDSCWRWLLHRNDSPWYPTARLYRQCRPGIWDDPIEQIRRDLGQLAGNAGSAAAR